MGDPESNIASLADGLERWLTGARRVAIIGVGNPVRSDDNVGVEVVRGLEGRIPESVLLIESETIPEEHMEQVIDFKPTHVLIVDAALLGLSPGAAKLVESLEILGTAFSTHFLPVQIFCEYVARMTGAKVAMLLVQPKDTSFGEGLSPELSATKERLLELLARVVGSAMN